MRDCGQRCGEVDWRWGGWGGRCGGVGGRIIMRGG